MFEKQTQKVVYSQPQSKFVYYLHWSHWEWMLLWFLSSNFKIIKSNMAFNVQDNYISFLAFILKPRSNDISCYFNNICPQRLIPLPRKSCFNKDQRLLQNQNLYNFYSTFANGHFLTLFGLTVHSRLLLFYSSQLLIQFSHS